MENCLQTHFQADLRISLTKKNHINKQNEKSRKSKLIKKREDTNKLDWEN